MFGVPKKERLTGLVGKELVQVCISSHQVILKFDEDAQINVESSFQHMTENKDVRRYDDFWKQDSSLTSLLSSSVIRVENVNDRRLCLHFSNGEAICLSDDSDEYESFHISIEGEVIVV